MKTEKKTVVALIQALNDSCEQQLSRLPFKKGIREALLDGFKDGSRSGVWETIRMLGVEVVDEDVAGETAVAL